MSYVMRYLYLIKEALRVTQYLQSEEEIENLIYNIFRLSNSLPAV